MSQVRETYMVGVHNETNVSVPMRTMDLSYVASYFTLRSVKGHFSVVYLSTRGMICGIQTDASVDNQRKTYGYICKSCKVLEEKTLSLRKGESLRKLTVSYTDTAIVGMSFVTELQKLKIGELDHSDYTTEADHFSTESAILGFAATFGADRLVELGLIVAPILRDLTAGVPLTKPYVNGSSFALVDENFYEMMKQQNDHYLVQSVFKESKTWRKLKSM